ncbi:MAG: N-acetylmuramoyl-L-alanine amidase-like domain-containing protein [Proteiniphilum sp.]
MKLRYMTLLLFVVAGLLAAQPKACFTPEDRLIFDQYLSYIGPYQHHSTDTLLEKTATFFLGKPYVANTLEITDEEMLVVNLREFDCTTFVETVIALTRTAKLEKPSFDAFLAELQQIRYRNGEINGYAARLHYTSDWMYENEQNGRVRNLSAVLGGIQEEKPIHFMSAHRDAYKRLKTDDAVLQEIMTVEKEINRRGGFAYLPKAKIASIASHIPHMAMIGFTTDIEGLDISHVGFAFQKEDKLTFMHASSARKKVVIDEKKLSDYCAGQKSCTGVLVAELM